MDWTASPATSLSVEDEVEKCLEVARREGGKREGERERERLGRLEEPAARRLFSREEGD